MAIRSDIDFGLVDVGTGDTTVVQIPTGIERIGITAAIAHNTTGGDLDLTLWESPDLTSASGDEIAFYAIPGGESVDIIELIGQGYEGTNIIAQGSGAGVNFRATVITYSEGD
jgi:hypothetical protein